jgi:sigma-B regulation protein RsbU (phosphoserine phosphatase)
LAEHSNVPIRQGLISRRQKLEKAIASAGGSRTLEDLLGEVEAALERLDKGAFGLCEVCQKPIEVTRLVADPFARVCIDHLSSDQQQALEDDLSVASKIQEGLLPQEEMQVFGWEAAYHYEAAGMVSGDYCDLLIHGGNLYFIVGDVSGKGVSAAMLMTHLHATFRALVSQDLPLGEVMERASRMFCESTLPTHFATLALGKANASGDIDLCIAGHLPVLVRQASDVRKIGATGLPLGMFCDGSFSLAEAHLTPGDCLVLYTDGLTESVDSSGVEYGIDRLANLLVGLDQLSPKDIISACRRDLESFRAGTAIDDLTLLVIRRSPSDDV